MRNILSGIMLFLSILSWAQNREMRNMPPADKAQKFMKVMTKELTLTQEQQNKAEPIVLNMFTKINALRADTAMEKRTRGKAIMAERRSGSDAFRALLSNEQAVLYDKKIEEMKAKKGDRKGNQPADDKGKNKGVKKAAAEELDNDDLF